MKRLTKFLVYLYPRRWRDRYGPELETLLEDIGSPWSSIPDTLTEALKMRLQNLNWRTAASFAMVSLVVATAASFRLPPRYSSSEVVLFDPAPEKTPEVQREELQNLRRYVLSRASLTDLLQTPGLNLYADERGHRPFLDIIDEMRESDLQVELINSPTPGLRITYAGSSPAVASATTATLAQRILVNHDKNRSKLLRLAGGNKIEPSQVGKLVINAAARVAAPPSVSEIPASPVRWRYALVGLLAGIGVWAWFTLVRCSTITALRASLVALLVVAVSYAVPFPYFSQAVLVFDSPETLQNLLTDQAVQHASRTVSVERTGARVLAVTATAAKYNFLAQRKGQEYVSAVIKAVNSRYSSYENSLLYPAGHWVDIVDTPSLPTIYSGANWRGATTLLGLCTLLTALILRRLDRRQRQPL